MFRPSLRGLIAGNSEDTVREVTREAFAGVEDAVDGDYADVADVMKSLKVLCRLKGVGPATASLILSVAYPSIVPFFADELFAWISLTGDDQVEEFFQKMSVSQRNGDGKSVRFDKMVRIKYSDAEYKRLYAAVGDLRRRSKSLGYEASASDIERAAYVVMQGLEVSDLETPVGSKDSGSRSRSTMDVDPASTKQSKSDTESAAKPLLEPEKASGDKQRRIKRSSKRNESPPQLRSSKRRKVMPD